MALKSCRYHTELQLRSTFLMLAFVLQVALIQSLMNYLLFSDSALLLLFLFVLGINRCILNRARDVQYNAAVDCDD